eukprot:TRINITY_DN371_c0_g1_i1.p1 TRINITY_DN371_c0_g1~~TRINITY_DN371_c0_g1_i1.p1  ORF type:complete len:431 (+),score=135.91 TRINITY_DN371_c0_g1_i1:253-1545(+)
MSDNKDEKKEIKKIIIPDFDLEGYISMYTGHTKIGRLIFVAEHAEGFGERAYKLLLNELKTTTNTKLYKEICKKVGETLGPEYKQDDEWVLKTDKKISMDAEFLDTKLNNAKQSLDSKEIRDSHNKMGEHYYDRGELNSALKCYVRTRDYCTTPQHVIEMCLNVIKVNIEMNNFAHVLNYVGKAEQNPGDIDPATRGKLNVCAGLANLENKKYKDAARKFLNVSKELSGNFSHVISERDIGLFACLCGLAEFGRDELRTNILENIDFKYYLDLVPQMQQVISDFYNSKYSTSLATLEKIRGDFEVDLHLNSHVPKLYEKIRAKAIIQYFSPYSSVDLNLMSENFNTTPEKLEKELADMIVSDIIQARIDSQNKVLYAKQVDQRTATFAQSLSTGNNFQQNMKDMLLKMNLIENDFVVKPNKKMQDDHDDD